MFRYRIAGTWGDVSKLTNKQQILKVLNGNTHFVSRMLDEKKAFQDEEVILTTPQGQVHCLASGTPIIDEQGSVDSAVILMRPIKEVHKLVNRFSGAQASYYFSNIIMQSDIMLGLIQNGSFKYE